MSTVMEDLLAESKIELLKEGSVITGTIMEVRPTEVVIDFGGKAEDYQAIHDWFDESKKIMADFRHRALRHHAEGCFACEEKFGTTITNSDGKKVPVRLIAERHIKEDLGFIPSMIDWFKWIQPQKFMRIGYMKDEDIMKRETI